MTLLGRNFIVSMMLALSDFVSFIASIYFALGILSIFVGPQQYDLLDPALGQWIVLHWLLALCCIGWFSMRLRHYFYRKTFWFELKEILRTLLIFSIIEIAVVAFATWPFLVICGEELGYLQ